MMRPDPEVSLRKGAAMITVATAVSRLTGFLRVVAVAAAMGTTFLANTYQSANTAPNLIFELVAAGILTSVFVPTFVDHLVRGEKEKGWEAANALASVALVGLTAIAVLLALAAPVIMRLLLIGVDDPTVRSASVDLGTRFLRLFAPQVIFYGAGMIMTAALHAHRRFAIPAVAPIFNNVVVIGTYLGYIVMRGNDPVGVGEVTGGEVLLLGAGTTMGVVAMTVCLLPSLRAIGWKFRFNFDPQHPSVRKGARLGAWALGYAGGYQAGLIVVLILANRIEGGVAAYQWAFTFFYLPHALFGVPIFHVLFTAMAEHVSRGEESDLMRRLRDGLGMLGFILLPVSAALFVLAGPLARVTLDYGVMTDTGATLVARTLGAFVVGLPTYSAFLVLTRAFYALGDVKTPTFVNAGAVVISSAVGLGFFLIAPEEWVVPGLALGHSIAFAVGCAVLGRLLGARMGAGPGEALRRSLVRSGVMTVPAGVLMYAVQLPLSDAAKSTALAQILLAGILGAGVYVWLMMKSRSPELRSVVELAKGLRHKT
jgi:putative peptidoglycan lipid II flippase